MNNSEGNVVCIECGCISEDNIWLHDPSSTYDDSYRPYERDFEHMLHLEFPEMVFDVAYVHFKKIQTNTSYRSIMKKTIIANCIYMACNELNIPREVKEIASLCGVSKTDLLKVQAQFCTQSVLHADDQIIRYVSHLGLHNDISIKMAFIKRLRQLVNNDDLLESKAPNTRISTFIFIVAQEMNLSHITKKAIVEQFDLSLVTLNKSLKEFITNFT